MSKTSIVYAGLVASFALIGAGCAQNKVTVNTNTNPSPVAEPRSISFKLTQLSLPGQSGVARVVENGSKVTVVLSLENEPATAVEPAHIHAGACPAPGAIKFSLNDVVAGRSSTDVDVDFDSLLKMLPLAINVHKSAADLKTYVACGNLVEKNNATAPDPTKVDSAPTTMKGIDNPKADQAQNNKKAVVTGAKQFTVTATNFTFAPSIITVKKGDQVTLTMVGKEGDHGLAIPAFGVSKTFNQGETVTVSFTADKTGSFPFFCNVFCGEGHRDMKGTLIVE